MAEYDIAELQTIRLADLKNKSQNTRDQLLSTCQNYGFFYLELDDQDSPIMKAVTYLTEYSKRLFDIPDEEKLRFPFPIIGRGGDSGYKLSGTETGAFGPEDGFERYMLPYNELMLTGYPHELVAPDVVLNDRAILSNHVREYHSVGLLLLEAFSDFLKLPYLLEAHKPSEPNASSLTFLKYNAHQPSDTGGHVSHTDIGTLTLLHSSDFGLQVFHPIHQLWQWVAPRPNSLVINVGDSLNLLTGQSLKSSLHRVIPHHQVQDRNRYSFGYFMRPTEKAVLGLVEGESTTSLEWYHKKITLFADSWDVQQNQKELLYGEF